MVLGCDVALAGKQACAGDVGTTITEFHLECVGACGTGKQLMAQADTEDGCSCLIHGSFDVLHSAFNHGWITRSVRDEQTIVVFPRKLRKVVVPRHLQDFNASSDEASKLVVFKTDVNGNDTDGASRGVLESSLWVWRPKFWLFDGD